MVSKKYLGDYRLENVPDHRGKLKTVPVYRGPLFRFTAKEEVLKKAKRRNLLLVSLITAALLTTMLLHSGMLSRIYVAMPLVLSILPAVLLWTGVFHLFTAGDSVPRDKSDHIHNRIAGWSTVLIILSSLSLIGQIFAYFDGGGVADLPVTLCAVVIVACASLVFLGKKDLLMEMIPADP